MEEAPFAERLSVHAERVRVGGGLGRSDLLRGLLDFLVVQSAAGRAPKEVEIAQEVFGKTGEFDVMLDASVRVYIHRLRRKIDEFYAAESGGAERLYIPKGEYRLALSAPEAPSDSALAPPAPAATSAGRRAAVRWRVVAAAAAVLLSINACAWWLIARRAPADAAAQVATTHLWKGMAGNGRPIIVATGDYYIFGESPDGMNVQRLVREFAINSKDDLDQYLMDHPVQIGRYVDMGLHYVPTSIPGALRDILPVVDRVTSSRAGRELVVPMSQLTPDMLKKANIVYVGYLSALGLLREPVFAASGFKVGASYDELIDRKTGRRFLSDQGDVGGQTRPQRDYAYLIGLPGPSGGRLLAIGGMRDAGVLQAAEIVSDPRQLARIDAAVGNAPAFEALYEVRTLDGLNFGSRLVIARSLGDAWTHSLDEPHPQRFPDQLEPPTH